MASHTTKWSIVLPSVLRKLPMLEKSTHGVPPTEISARASLQNCLHRRQYMEFWIIRPVLSTGIKSCSLMFRFAVLYFSMMLCTREVKHPSISPCK